MAHKDPKRRAEYAKAWRERNRERVAAVAKAWREKNRERVAAVDKAWREQNRERKKATNRAWHKRNPERRAKYDKARYERNRERVAAVGKAWYERNRERVAAAGKAWREQNRERVAAAAKAWREANRERRAAAAKAWHKRNHESVIERNRRRRSRKRNASVYLTANETQQIVILERTRQELQRETGREYHIDHILPISHGGIHHPMNLRILDGRENISKQDKLLPEAIALASEHFRLYSERVSPERAWEFVRQLAAGLELSEEELNAIIDGKPPKRKNTLEEFFI
jgi:hypothetical protein